MILTDDKHLLMVEPNRTSNDPVIDNLTRMMAAAYRQATTPDYGYRGVHVCTGEGCNATSSNTDHTLPNGQTTNSLCVHYLAFHREDIPAEELEKVAALTYGEVEPNDQELAAPARR